MKPAIVVLGSLNMDFVVRTDHLPVAGETVLGRDFQMIPEEKARIRPALPAASPVVRWCEWWAASDTTCSPTT